MHKASQQPSDELNRTHPPDRAQQRHDAPKESSGIIHIERLSKADVIYALSLTIASLIAYRYFVDEGRNVVE